MATIDDLNIVTQAFLDAAIAGLELTLQGAPTRAFISPGEPAIDCCGQCTVWAQTLTDADLNAGNGALAREKAVKRGTQPEATIFIQITRCVDVTPLTQNGLPNPLKLQAAANTINQDAWTLRCHMLSELRHGDLAQICSGAVFLGATALVPQGGCAGWTFSFRYPLEGGVIAP